MNAYYGCSIDKVVLCIYSCCIHTDAVCESLSVDCSHAGIRTHTCTHNSHHLRMYVHVDCAGAGPPSPPVEVTAKTDPSVQSMFVQQNFDFSLSKPSYMDNFSLDSPLSQCHSDSTQPNSARTDRSRYSSNQLFPAVPAAPPNPMVYLTEEEDEQDAQAAEIAWSADATTSKPIGKLLVRPGTTYALKVPPQQEEVVMKFTTFGNSKSELGATYWKLCSKTCLLIKNVHAMLSVRIAECQNQEYPECH